MKHQQIKALVQVADCGSIRAAARSMHISQSALTRAMRELEEDVGAELLNRSYRGVSFTPAGKALLSRARLILSTLERAREEVRQISGGAGATVTLGITPVLGVTALPDVYKQFAQVMPEAELVLKEGLLTEIIPDLIEGELDFGIGITSQEQLPTELSYTPLCALESRIFGRAGHPLAKARDWSDLQDARWILNLTGGSPGDLLLRWLYAQGLPRPSRIVRCYSPMLMLEMMRRTDLIGFGPGRLIDDPLAGVGVETFAVQPQPPAGSVGIVRMRGMPLTPAAQMMVTLIQRAITSGYGDELANAPPELDEG
ncbi:LysR substrate-binding domain-containing protein [Marinobacterium sp. YM272]|uniref:LysR substrate-binding domain-containing protein n=1 Tax=Marinobacterium sp. YM272 TaxID=3421654 RepID=UPI003D7F4215